MCFTEANRVLFCARFGEADSGRNVMTTSWGEASGNREAERAHLLPDQELMVEAPAGRSLQCDRQLTDLRKNG